MKPINLKTSLSRFTDQVIRVEATLSLISKVREDKPRTVLLKNISISGQIITDHMWLPYSKAWDKFSSKHKNQKFTFKTKVITMKSASFKKYRLGKITQLSLLCDYKNPNQVKESPKLEILNPDTASLIPLLPISQKTSIEIVATAESLITNDSTETLILSNITANDSIKIATMPVQLTEFQVNHIKDKLPCKIAAKMSIMADLFKVLPYQPVKATKLKNLHILKDK